MTSTQPRILIIGGDHHNTLAMVRCFGQKKVEMRILIHTEKKQLNEVCLASSKYAKDCVELVAESPEEVLISLHRNSLPGLKQVLFPCSDFAEYIIDSHADELQDSYILPGFENEPGKVAFLMDKMQQKLLAEEYHIPMARTWALIAENGHFQIPEDMIFPCILKPEISAEGSKGDIVICETKQMLEDALGCLQAKGYVKILAQQFLHKKYEICAFGSIFNSEPYFSGGITHKLNEYPPQGGGSLTFARFTNDPQIHNAVNSVRNLLFESGYRGLYDIEFLVCEDNIYLNEINFRHSGNGYALIHNKVLSPYLYYLNVIGKPFPTKIAFNISKERYHMDELLEWQLLKSGYISYSNCIKCIVRSSAFAKYDIRDLQGTWAYYRPWFTALKDKFCKRKC